MLSLFSLPSTLQAFLASMCAWLLTSLGALSVFFFYAQHRTLLNAMLAAGGGVMLASAFWSLLSPAVSTAEQLSQPGWLICTVGFLCGGLLLMFFELLIERLRNHANVCDPDRRRRMLITSITLHNIPEGLAMGVAFGAAFAQQEYVAAWMLAIGIGLQNIPEGAAVSMPLHRDGMTKSKAAVYGIMSGIVEPIAGLLGALWATSMQSIMPLALSFAAGAMVLVVIAELIPESLQAGRRNLMSIAALVGFAVMMLLDLLLG